MKEDRRIEDEASMYFGDGDELTTEDLELLKRYKNQGYDISIQIDEFGLKVLIEKEANK